MTLKVKKTIEKWKNEEVQSSASKINQFFSKSSAFVSFSADALHFL